MYQNIFITPYADGKPSIVHVWDDKLGLQRYPISKFKYAYRPDTNGQYTSIYDTKFSKVTRFDFDEAGLYESDVSRETRVLTDLYPNEDDPSTGHRIAFFDIEVSSDGGFATTEAADKPVTAIGHYDSVEQVYYCFILDPDKRIESMERVKNGQKEVIISCETEIELLEMYLALYKANYPTILTGWNIDGYDVPYLYNRLNRVLGRNAADSLSPIGVVIFNEHREKFQIAGVSTIDYLPMYKKYTYVERENYQLNTVGLAELNRGKIQYEGTLDQLYENDVDTFIEYNIEDVKIVVELERKLKMIELIRFICHLGHVQYEDYGYSSKFIEGTILTYIHRKGLIAPNKPVGGREAFEAKMASNEDDFEGAFVKPPMPGLYEWIYSLDLTSLYPSVIMSLNISPETKVGRIPNWNPELYIGKKVERYTVIEGNVTLKFTADELTEYLEQNEYTISSNGILYRTDKQGIIPEILSLWFQKRKEYKKLMFEHNSRGETELGDYYDRRQHVQKILLNSIYGVLGLSIFRFYDLDNAAAVTTSGQDIIRSTSKYINGKYKKFGVPPKDPQALRTYEAVMRKDYRQPPVPEDVIKYCLNPEDHCAYIDTDSVYFSSLPLMSNVPEEDRLQYTIDWATQMEGELNKFYDVVAKRFFNCDTHRLSIKGEAISRTALWLRKKRYALKKVYDLEEGAPVDKMTIKGLDIVRSSFPQAYKVLMKGILKDILDGKLKEYVDGLVLQFKSAMISMDYKAIARNTSVKDIAKYDMPTWSSMQEFTKGTPAHVKAAITYNRVLEKLGKSSQFRPIRNGDKVKWVYLTRNAMGIDTIAFKTYDDPPEILELVKKHIDYDALFEHELENKLLKFYTALGWGDLPIETNPLASDFFNF